MNKLIGISGKIGSGKDTFTQLLQYCSNEQIQKLYPNYNEFLNLCYNIGSYGISNNWCDYNNLNLYENKKFAFKVKQIVSIMTGIKIEDLEKIEVKNSILPSCWNKDGKSMTVREFIQKLATDAIRNNLHENAWVNSLFSDYKEDSKWIISDLRFLNEADAIKLHNGYIIRLNRKIDLLPTDYKKAAEHRSETELDDYKHFDLIYDNNKSLDELYHFIKENHETFF